MLGSTRFDVLEADRTGVADLSGALDRLLAGELGGVLVRGWVDAQPLERLVRVIEANLASDAPVLTSGFPLHFRSFFLGRALDLAATDGVGYFEEATRWAGELAELERLAESDLGARAAELLSLLGDGDPVEAPPGPDDTRYIPLTIRCHETGGFIPPHCEQTQRDRAQYDDLRHKLDPRSILGQAIALQAPAAGGELAVYRLRYDQLDPALIVDGRLLLANAYFELGELGAARLLLENLPENDLSPDRFWRKHYMLASVYLADASLNRALSGATNLVQLAKGISNSVYAARSVDFHGDVLRRMGQPDDAVAMFERNLATNIPPDWRRTALLKIVDLYVEENRLTNAVQRLQRLFIRHPGDPATGLAHLTLGELRLRQFYDLPDASRLQSTNLLSEALGHFDVILKAMPMRTWRANRGLDAAGRFGSGPVSLGRIFN